MILNSYFYDIYPERKADNLDKDSELRLVKYLLRFKLNKELREFCKKNNLKTSGNKDKLIETIGESCSIKEILHFTEDIRLSKIGVHIDSELLELRKKIGVKTFDKLIHLAPLSVYEILVVATLMSGPKTRSEIFSDAFFVKFLTLDSIQPKVQKRLGEQILRDVRESLVSTGILSLKPGVWEYSINPDSMDYLKEIEISKPDELYNRVKESREEQVHAPRERINVVPTESFRKSPGALSVYIGRIGEELAGRHLLENGYEVCKFPDINRLRTQYSIDEMELGLCPHIKCKKPIIEVKLFCNNLDSHVIKSCKEIDPKNLVYVSDQAPCPCTSVYPQLCENCTTNKTCPVYEIFNLLGIKEVETKEKYYHALDFIAHKDGKDYLVEVKTNRKRDKIRQKEILSHMKSFGLNPLLAFVTIPFNQIKDEIEIII